MIVYLAGTTAASFYRSGRIYGVYFDDKYRQIYDYSVVDMLESYHYIKKQIIVDRIRYDQNKVFLDSGAFSAYTQGASVDIQAYCDFIKRNMDIIRFDNGVMCASVLDAIGDENQTYQNQMYMERQGVAPLPCYHYGEPPEVLEYYATRYPYITIGGMVPITTPQLRLWLDRIWGKYLTTPAGYAKVKVHGFGMTAPALMERYPWHSVDSSSWVQIGNFGNILVWDNMAVAVSQHSPSVKNKDKHLRNMPAEQRAPILAYIEKRGFTEEELAGPYYYRWLFNCLHFTELGKKMAQMDKPFRPEVTGFFG